MGSGFAKKKKEAKLMEQRFREMEASLKEQRVEGSAGNGLVSITLNGKGDLIDISIKPDCMDPEDPECLEDLIKAAYKNARESLETNNEILNPTAFPF
ncbi:YbaB/EbfC family nucleoid-associated protein [Chlamydiifrater phoenicopteri]|uniref:YbaB/EbfC family nucleoid-associated protein n=1 Tax=Chlamydiifrater phoenicopteri TaxID=2681469 RepID=UPI001BD08697|nr:YbaB/EbfC family nucleoid-associated protein [Chlamydiifrater phoenicopteri]